MLRSGQCLGIFLGPPCGTYSCACHPALRSLLHLFGLPHLAGTALQKTLDANAVTDRMLRILEIANACQVPWICENPQTSMLWQLPRMLRIRKKAFPVHLHQCGFGTPWKKPTTLLCSRISDPKRMEVRCKPIQKICSHSGRHHTTLQGALTSRAAQYPRKMCDQIALVLSDTAWCHQFNILAE